MNKVLTFFALFLFSTTLVAQKYVLVWADEFNTPGLPDSTKWSYETGKIRNNELQYYTSKRLENARIEDSVLIIENRKEKYNSADYTSASIISKGIGDWLYGKVEISAKVPGGKGTWPALWMMPTYSEYGSWPRSGEIDIMEYIGVEPQNLFYTTHFEGTDGTGHQSSGSGAVNKITNPFNQFIKFTLIWTPEKLEWYANDVKYHTYTKRADDYRIWPFNKEFYLILNLAYGGNWAGSAGVDDSKLPHKFLIDYVRIYQLQDTEEPFSLTIDSVVGGTVEVSPKLDFYLENTEVTLTAKADSGFAFTAWKHTGRANPYTFKVVKNTTITPVFYDENEMITNGAFDKSWSSWYFYVYDNNLISYTPSIVDGVFVNDITKTTGTDWHFGFQETGLSMRKGKYKLTFEAYADLQKTLLITVSKNYSDWGEIVHKNATISTSKKNYEMILDMPRDDENVRLYFGIGQFKGKFYIDNISLSRIEDTPTGIRKTIGNNNEILIYPNPANGAFTVQLSNENDLKEHKLEMFSLDGKLIYQTVLKSLETDINPGQIQQGIYLIKVKSNSGCTTTRLIVN